MFASDPDLLRIETRIYTTHVWGFDNDNGFEIVRINNDLGKWILIPKL